MLEAMPDSVQAFPGGHLGLDLALLFYSKVTKVFQASVSLTVKQCLVPYLSNETSVWIWLDMLAATLSSN